MPPTLKHVSTESQLAPLIQNFWDANHHPYDTYLQLVFSTTTQSHEVAISDTTKRMWKEHESNKNSHWVYIEDEGEVVSGARWNFYEEVEDIYEEEDNATWQPEGEEREFTNYVLKQIHKLKNERMKRPYAHLSLLFTSPAHRKKGYANILLQYGIQIATSKKLEVLIEGSDMGKPLYEKFGLRTVEKVVVGTWKEEMSEEWLELRRRFGEWGLWWMWKPSGREVWEEGMKYPWEV